MLLALRDLPFHAINVSAPSPGLFLYDQEPKPWARLWALSTLRGSGFRDVERRETLTLRTPECRNSDVTRSRAMHPLYGRLISFLACNIDATYRANPGATPLTMISLRLSIFSYG